MNLWAQGEKESSLMHFRATSELAAGHSLQLILLGSGRVCLPLWVHTTLPRGTSGCRGR